MKARGLLIAVCLLGVSPLAVAKEPVERGSYRFVLGKLAAIEGEPEQALEEYERAVKLGPDDPYLRLEFGELLLRMARSGGGERGGLLRRAREQAEAAGALAPENRDVLRLRADIELSLTESEPAAVDRARAHLETLRRSDPGDLGTMTALGQLYLRQQRFGDAAAVFREAIQNRPRSRMLYPLLVEALVRSERVEEAMAALRELLAADAGAMESRLTLADLLSDRGEHQAAVETLRGAPAEQSGDVELNRRLAFELFRTGDLTGAERALQPLLAAEPDSFPGRYLRALILEAQARSDEAAGELEALTARAPENIDLSRALARVRERQGRLSEAAALLEAMAVRQAAAGKADVASALRLQVALAWSRNQRWPETLGAVEPLLADGDTSVRADAALIQADALSRLGRGEEALAALDRFIAAGSTAPLVAQRAETLFRLDRRAEAVAALDGLIAGGDPRGVLLAAEVYQRFDDWQRAIAILETARRADPGSSELAFRLAAAYERGGRRDEAIAAFRLLIEHQPDFAPALNYLGYMYAERGESLDEALRLARRAVDLDPGNGAYVDSLGWAHFQRREYDAARDQLERAAGLLPTDATILEHLGDVYRALGDDGRAGAAYQKALGLESENAEAVRRKLAALRSGS